ncbi:hypothetical protein, partial [Pseudomonas aeruginosa]
MPILKSRSTAALRALGAGSLLAVLVVIRASAQAPQVPRPSGSIPATPVLTPFGAEQAGDEDG